jgi:hypothetical protein
MLRNNCRVPSAVLRNFRYGSGRSLPYLRFLNTTWTNSFPDIGVAPDHIQFHGNFEAKFSHIHFVACSPLSCTVFTFPAPEQIFHPHQLPRTKSIAYLVKMRDRHAKDSTQTNNDAQAQNSKKVTIWTHLSRRVDREAADNISMRRFCKRMKSVVTGSVSKFSSLLIQQLTEIQDDSSKLPLSKMEPVVRANIGSR